MKVTTETINRIYQYAVFRHNERCGETITVPGLSTGEYIFCRERLEEKYMYILSAVKGLPHALRYSENREGAPWILARGEGSRYKGVMLESVEHLLVMAVALRMARILKPRCAACDVPNIVIDDERLRKLEMMQPKSARRYALINW